MVYLTQKEADDLIQMVKWIEQNELPVIIPLPGKINEYSALCALRKNKFTISLRRGSVASSKVTFQGRTSNNQVLLRIDICGQNKKHMNPDGSIIAGSHIHIYKEGYGERYAEPFNPGTDSLTDVCKIFFDKFCIIDTMVYEQTLMGGI